MYPYISILGCFCSFVHLFSVHLFPSIRASLYVYVSTRMLVCPRVGYHRRSAAFNEGDGRKINIVPLKMISSHLFYCLSFPSIYCVGKSVWKHRERGGRTFESLHPSVNISLSSFMPLFSFIHSSHHSCALWALFLTLGQPQWNYNSLLGKCLLSGEKPNE